MSDERLPTALWVEGHLQQLTLRGIPFYYIHKGAYAGGMVMLKLAAPGEGCDLLQQQRDLDGNLGWMKLFKGRTVEESEADAYIQRAISRDPDLWVIEIEDREKTNPFEGPVFE